MQSDSGSEMLHSERLEAARAAGELQGLQAQVAWLEALLFAQDPIGINFDSNTDEYRPEAETITLRRQQAASVADVQRIVHDEFCAWFRPDDAGPLSKYELIASELSAYWNV